MRENEIGKVWKLVLRKARMITSLGGMFDLGVLGPFRPTVVGHSF
jgi:hypothetical protein